MKLETGKGADTMLYHYTSIRHLPMILQSQYLKLTDSMLRDDDLNYKPVV